MSASDIGSGDVAASIAGNLSNASIDGDTLTRLNGVFSDDDLGTLGGFVHTPTGYVDLSTSSTIDAGLIAMTPVEALTPGHTYVLDVSTAPEAVEGILYRMGSSLDDSDSGKLIIEKNGSTLFTFEGDYSQAGFKDGALAIGLPGPDGRTLAELLIDTFTGDASVQLASNSAGSVNIPLSSLGSATLTVPTSGSALDVVMDYLDQLGSTTTASQVSQLNTDLFHPDAGSSHTITPSIEHDYPITVNGNLGVQASFIADTPGAIITGVTSSYYNSVSGPVTCDVLNVLGAGGTMDLSVDTISDIQVLSVGSLTEVSRISLTAIQFAGFTSLYSNSGISGWNQILAATGGTYSLASKDVDGLFDLVATSWEGTTLIGNDEDYQSLIASEFGNDTLVAGDGAHAWLGAGYGNDVLTGDNGGDTFQVTNGGVDTLTGGTGNDEFIIDGIGAGSTIDGGGGTDILNAEGNLTGVTISNIETLEAGDVSLNATQLGAFAGIEGKGGFGSINAVGGGTFDLSGNSTDHINLSTTDDANTTLIGNDADYEVLSASGTADYTLTAGDGIGDELNVDGSGTNTLTGGDGGDVFTVGENATGTNTLTGGDGDDTFNVSGNAGTIVIDGGDGTDTLALSGRLTGMTLSSIEVLQADDAVLTAAQFNGFDAITTSFGYGDIEAVGGGTFSLDGVSTDAISLSTTSSSATTLQGNDADYEYLTATGDGDYTLTAGDGTGDVLEVDGAGDHTLTAGDGGDSLLVGGNATGINVLTGGTGDDTFIIDGTLVAGSSISGGGGNNTLTSYGDVSAATLSGVSVLADSYVTLTASQLAGFTTLSGYGTVYASTAGTYSLAALTLPDNGYSLDASLTSADVTLVANAAGSTLVAGSGDTTMTGGVGDDIFDLSSGTTGTVTGNGGDDVVSSSGDITGFTISGVATLDDAGSVKLTAAQFAAFDTITSDGYAGLEAADAGTYDLTGKTFDGEIDLDASETTGAVALNSGGQDSAVLTGGAYDDTLTGSGYTYYTYNEDSFGHDTIINSGGSGEIDLFDMTSQDLWFKQVGSDLEIDRIGTSDKVTVQGWFGDTDLQVGSIVADDAALTDQVASLVSAMASFATGNPSFDPGSATAMPTDTTLQLAISNSWQS